MRKVIMTMVALLSMTVMTAQTTNSENNKPQQEMKGKRMTHEEMTTQMTSKLNLSDEQKTKVAALNKEYQDCLMSEPPQRPDGQQMSKDQASSQTSGSKPQMKKTSGKKQASTETQAKRQEYDKKLKEILTDDQYKSYQSMKPQRKAGMTKGQKKSKQTTQTKQTTL